ncbi:MAG: HGGxSTG domain-containing protein [Gammaproteobacteria bacterium]|nr:HGGxSTG domain-containing protein [Gammaproteobacteria bacterium]
MPRRSKLPCGAKTRAGPPCKRMALRNGRCRNHGGLSTGPRSPEGMAKSLAALQAGWRRWYESKRRQSKGYRDILPLIEVGQAFDGCFVRYKLCKLR